MSVCSSIHVCICVDIEYINFPFLSRRLSVCLAVCVYLSLFLSLFLFFFFYFYVYVVCVFDTSVVSRSYATSAYIPDFGMAAHGPHWMILLSYHLYILVNKNEMLLLSYVFVMGF